MACTQNKPIVEVRDTPAHYGSHRLFARNFAETGERFTWFSLRWRNNGRTRVLLALQRFRSKDGTHDESRPRVGPRPTAEHVQQQPSKKNRGQIRTKLGLFGVGVHSCATHRAAYFLWL